MTAMVRRWSGSRAQPDGQAERAFAHAREVLGFAAKVIGIGLFAGLSLTYCNAVIAACFSGLH